MTTTKITKAYIYEQLTNIHRSENIDIQPYIDLMIGRDDIPYEVIVFVNKHVPLPIFSVYNSIYDKRKKSRLYRNILNNALITEEKAIVLSSILTQVLIDKKHNRSKHVEYLNEGVDCDMIIDALQSYMYDNDDTKVLKAFEVLQTIFRALFNKLPETSAITEGNIDGET